MLRSPGIFGHVSDNVYIWLTQSYFTFNCYSSFLIMEQDMKQDYLAPTTLVFEVVQEGIICQSGGVGTNGSPTFNGFNSEEEW